MKVRITFRGYEENRKKKTFIMAQGTLVKDSPKQVVISINGSTRTINKKDIIETTYFDENESFIEYEQEE